MQRTCQQCGMQFEAKRSTAKYCGSACRARRAKNVPPVAFISPPAAEGEPHLVRMTRQVLVEAGRLDTPGGAAAMVAAERASNPGTSDSAVSGLLKQHAASLADALRGAAKATGPQMLQDELAERRRKHGA